MVKKVFVVLIGDADGKAVDLYQHLQEKDALAQGRAAGYEVEVVWASSFDQYGAVRKRLAASPVDAVVAEPASVATAGLILKNLQGKTGLVLLNAWDESFAPYLAGWGSRPAGGHHQPAAAGDRADPGPAGLGRRPAGGQRARGDRPAALVGGPREARGPALDDPPRRHAPHDRGRPVVGDGRHPRLQLLVRHLPEPARGDPRDRRAERRSHGRGVQGRDRGREPGARTHVRPGEPVRRRRGPGLREGEGGRRAP